MWGAIAPQSPVLQCLYLEESPRIFSNSIGQGSLETCYISYGKFFQTMWFLLYIILVKFLANFQLPLSNSILLHQWQLVCKTGQSDWNSITVTSLAFQILHLSTRSGATAEWISSHKKAANFVSSIPYWYGWLFCWASRFYE